MALADGDKAFLSERGWVLVDSDPSQTLAVFAANVGTPVESRRGGPLVDRLVPTRATDARPTSLSAIHGLAAFPWHTDGAHWRIPPRLIALRLAGEAPSQRPTLVLPYADLRITDEEDAAVRRLQFVVASSRGIFLTPLVNATVRAPDWILRYDDRGITPAHHSSLRALDAIRSRVDRSAPVSIEWLPGKTLLVDNWRCLHARGVQAEDETGRVLERVLITSERP